MTEDLPPSTRAFKYDVAFSFLAEDEDLAGQLDDLIQDRVSTFFYSKRQEEIAGTDGEETFNEVFGVQARIVVVLYRSGWGETPWTRIEQTALRNRAFDEGYDFVLFIPLDPDRKTPKWLPKNRLWIGLERWGPEGAASVIEARVQEAGGSPHRETIAERAARLKREMEAKQDRKKFLGSYEGVNAAGKEIKNLHKHLETQGAILRDEIGFGIGVEIVGNSATLSRGELGIGIDWRSKFANSLDESKLEVTLWLGGVPRPGKWFIEKPERQRMFEFHFDRDRSGAVGWREKGKPRFLSTEAVAEKCFTILMEACSER